MFDWKSKTQFLRDRPGYNNATLVGVKIKAKENTNWAASVYRLSADENRGGSFIYIEVLCKQNERERPRGVNWGWAGMSPKERNETGAIFADKPDREIKSQPIKSGQRIWLEIAGGDRVENLHTVIDLDELTGDGHIGNARFQHSYLVLFQEVDKSSGPAPEPPTPEPTPEPPAPEPPMPEPPVLVGGIQVTVNQAAIASLRPDQDGNVTFFVGERR